MKSRVNNPRYLEKYFTQFPNLIDDSWLTPFEFRLLLHYYRVGECWEGVRKTAEICGMSTGKVATTRKSLEEKGFITIATNGDGIIINLVDLAQKNMEKYRSRGEQSVQVVDGGVHVVNSDRPSGEHKNNPIKNIIPSSDGIPELIVQCYKPFIQTWHSKYPVLLTMPKDGAKIKSIIKQVGEILKTENWEVTAENAKNFWGAFVQNLHRTWGHNKDLSTIDSKLKSLFLEMKPKGASRAGGRADSWESEFAEQAKY